MVAGLPATTISPEKRDQCAALRQRGIAAVRPGGDRVLEIDENVMLKWWLLVEEGRKAGHTFSQPDLIIGATALHHGLTIVSRDVSEYEMSNVPVLNPWKT